MNSNIADVYLAILEKIEGINQNSRDFLVFNIGQSDKLLNKTT
jgi:hypothetical protein